MYLVYADEQGKVYEHSELYDIARSGDNLVELLEGRADSSSARRHS